MEFLFVPENETFNILITIVLFATSFVVRFVCFFLLIFIFQLGSKYQYFFSVVIELFFSRFVNFQLYSPPFHVI
jgi:hypothetical protein